MGILLVYDVTDERSFQNVKNWMKQIDQHASQNVNRLLIGNKCDVPESERVSPSRQENQAMSLAKKRGRGHRHLPT